MFSSSCVYACENRHDFESGNFMAMPACSINAEQFDLVEE
jgi:hypothetical protein